MNLLAVKNYDPTGGAAVSKSMASLLAMTAFDTTNLRISTTVPAHGMLWFRIKCSYAASAATMRVLLGVLNGSAIVGRVTPLFGQPLTGGWMLAEFGVSGLAPGAITLDAAYGVEVVLASSNIKYGGPDDTTTDNAWGGILFEVWDPQPVPTAAPAAVGGLLTAPTTANVGLADLSRILGTALTETAGFLAAGFKKFFNITTPTLTVAGVDQTGDSFARIGAPVGASIAADIAAVPAAVWASGSRTLTSFGTLVSQVAAAVAALAVESGVTILGALQCILAGTTGETAEGPATQDFKAPDKTTTRVRTVSDTDGNRTSSTLTPDV